MYSFLWLSQSFETSFIHAIYIYEKYYTEKKLQIKLKKKNHNMKYSN